MAGGFPFTIVDHLGGGTWGTAFLVETELSPDDYAVLKFQREYTAYTKVKVLADHPLDPYEINDHECRLLERLSGLSEVPELYARLPERETTIEELGLDEQGFTIDSFFTRHNDTHRFFAGYLMEFKERLVHTYSQNLNDAQKQKLVRFLKTLDQRGVIPGFDFEHNLFAQGPNDIVVLDWHMAQFAEQTGITTQNIYRKNPLHDFPCLEGFK